MSDTRDLYKLFRELENQHQENDTVRLHDSFDLELNEHFVIESGVVGLTEDGVIIQLDEAALEFLDFNGMLTESEELNESALTEGSSQGVANAIRYRILNQHHDVIAKYGPVRIMAAIRDKADNLNDLEEIGSSDVSIWTNQVIANLEKGYYDDEDTVSVKRDAELEEALDSFGQGLYDRVSKHFAKVDPNYRTSRSKGGETMHHVLGKTIYFTRSGPDKVAVIDHHDNQPPEVTTSFAGLTRALKENVDESAEDSDIFEKIVKSDDPFQVVYDGLSGHFGEAVNAKLQDMYDSVASDNRYHPDDDFEQIIDLMLDNIEAAYGPVGQQGPYGSSTSKDELAEIKKLTFGRDALEENPMLMALGRMAAVGAARDLADNVDEGWGKNLLGAGAVVGALAAIAGVDKMEADRLMKTEPQLVTLTQMRQEAEQEGDDSAVDALDNRIRVTLNSIRNTGRPVMGPDGEPVDPRKPLGEAEYQGRKVTLNKPMQGDVAKSKVYVKKPDGKVVKVNFGDKNMTIKKSNPARRKSFRARHNCENPGPKWKARYWSCRAW